MDPSRSEKASKPPVILDRYSSLMSRDRQFSLNEQQKRGVTISPQLSNTPVTSSTVSEFLEGKVRMLEAEIDYAKCYQDGLHEALAAEKLGLDEYQRELDVIDGKFRPIVHELHVLKKQRRFLVQDFEDDLERHNKRQKAGEQEEPDIEFFERAYASEICARVMSATAKQKKRSSDQARFKREVSEYLGAIRETPGHKAFYCHVMGRWYDDTEVKAAHIVPKLLDGEELSLLFGVGKLVLSDRRNGITLHKKIEQALESGIIAIIPVAPPNESEETKWKCLLVDQSCRDLVFTIGHYWREIDGKELVFLTKNRPARRYLYFRFVMSYLNCKRTGNYEWTEKVDTKTVFWASPGEYLEKSTLLSLGRNISGFELPPPLYEGNTFDASSASDNDREMAMSMRLRDALRDTAKQKQCDSEEDPSEDEGSDEDSNAE